MAAAVLAVLLLVLALAIPTMTQDVQDGGKSAIRDAVLRSAVQCYAVEGVYPPSLEYLEAHYGLRVNHEDYVIFYDVFASNQLPNVRVLARGEG